MREIPYRVQKTHFSIIDDGSDEFLHFLEDEKLTYEVESD